MLTRCLICLNGLHRIAVLDSVNSMFIMFLSPAAGESLADNRVCPDLHGFKPGDYHHSNKIIERTDEQLGDFIPKLKVYDRRFPSDDDNV